MTAAAGATTQPDALTTSLLLESDARALAEAQLGLARSARFLARVFAPPSAARALERAQKYLATASTSSRLPPSKVPPKATEWFLDNYHLVRRVARQVEDELPRGFVRHLPLLARGQGKGRPRVEALARALAARAELTLDLALVRRFIDAYQEVSPLTIAELWALPTMLRAAVLLHLLRFLSELGVPVEGDVDSAPRPGASGRSAERVGAVAIDPAAGVERAVRALRVLDAIDWKLFFEGANVVEAILRTDPSNVYARMDFQTCDLYRKAVESLAWTTGNVEEDVANLVVELARANVADERRGHVGYYLVAEGRRLVEERLGYRAVGIERLRRLATRWPTFAYLAPLAFLTAAPLAALAYLLPWVFGAGSVPRIAVALVVAAVPGSVVAVTLLNAAFARLLPPRTLPKLDFKGGLPEGLKTLVVIPTLLGRAEDVVSMLRHLELHYLGNPDPELHFALLTDDLDRKTLPDESARNELLETASRGVVLLNARYGKDGHGPFHLLHRRPIWNPGEGRFMGWERKRGKLEELNRLLRGDESTSYAVRVGEPAGLLGTRFVITLDSDTELPMGSAQRLVGLLAHPLNRAVFEPVTDRVIAGYTIAQPRIDTSPTSARATPFSRIFAGDVGFDIYTSASSELYQDLFAAGIYVGKGIYDVDAFTRSLDGCAPENALVSHDLFEGVHGRTALATDIVLYESFPTTYATWAMRMHRWVRGDWQLFPWLFPTVPSASASTTRSNKLVGIDRWKIADNLRRSLASPLVLVLLVLCWSYLPGPAWTWTLWAVAMLVAPIVPALLSDSRRRKENLARAALSIAFLAYESAIVVDAIVRATVRRAFTQRLLLQWTTAAHAAFAHRARSTRAVAWRTMLASPLIALGLTAFLAWTDRSSLLVAAPLLLSWLAAPEIARWLSEPSRTRKESLTELERRELRLLARRTWRFFDAFVGPNDQWLPIDNHQEEPREQTAHRTSPTNIGLMLVATMSAYDFGYIGPSALSLRVRNALDSVARMPHYQGHLFNWYDTTNLEALLPRYVSTVDSGNFAGCLVALGQGCRDAAAAPLIRPAAWDGVRDSLALLEEVVESVPLALPAGLRGVIDQVQGLAACARDEPSATFATLRALTEEVGRQLDHELLAFLETGESRHDGELLHALRTSIDALHQQLGQMRREVSALLPWLALTEDAALLSVDLPLDVHLDGVTAVSARFREQLAKRRSEREASFGSSEELDAAAQRLLDAFKFAETNATALRAELLSLAARADAEVHGMEWKLLFDADRRLFHIGYDATTDQVDANYYDLLASEARLASYMAIIKRDVPVSHWYALGRPMTELGGGPLLLSWGGTMFEYLMPTLLMRSQEGTLLARTAAFAVEAQIAHGRKNGEPWGVSESSFARVDGAQTYQYRSFGVPGTGFRRGLEEDHVVTPYASLLAASIRPHAVLENVRLFEQKGMLGRCGLYEAMDFTPERAFEHGGVPPEGDGEPFAVVRSYMAHHQGMLLIALGNLLLERTMVDRFHADPHVQTGELLLNEHSPTTAPLEWLTDLGPTDPRTEEVAKVPPGPAPWTSVEHGTPQAFVLGNGHLTSLVTDSGGGGLTWQGLALTRYEIDATRDDDGLWFYLRDEDTGRVWLATSVLGRTTYSAHKAELHLRCEGISVHIDVAVAGADDVEVRQITLHNETSEARRLTVTSASRPVLLAEAQAPAHPAFSSMFVESEALAELDALVFARRPQSKDEAAAVLVHRLVHEGPTVTFGGSESDRSAFFGRGASRELPRALAVGGSLHGRVGAVLDPTMSVMAKVSLAPKASVALAFVTTVARTRGLAVALARKYGSMHAVRWCFRDADQECSRRLARTKTEPSLLPTVQRLFSAMLFADPALRAAPVEGAPRPCQHRLWGLGISGDLPIVLLRVRDAEAPITRELLSAQRYLRSCGVRLDVVLVDELASGYLTSGSATLKSVLVETGDDAWLDRRGGVFMVTADKLQRSALDHLEASARIVLDTRDGALASRFRPAPPAPPMLPRFEPTLASAGEERYRKRPPLLLDNGLGGFSEDGREYVIEVSPGEPTPAPWCNVLANPRFGCLVSESSFGPTWSENSGENRLTPFRNDAVLDTPSEALYLRDEETAAVWSTTTLPAGRSGQTIVRHGAGYTTYERESQGLVQELTVFVPKDASLKVVRLRLTNTLPRHRRLTATYYAEWVLGSRREAQRPYIVSAMERERACLLATSGWNEEFGARVAFLASREPVHGVTTDRAEFLGRRGDYARPEALERWGLSDRVDVTADPCAALQVHLGLAPSESVETHFILGQAASRDEALELASRFRDPAVVEASFQELGRFWDGVLGDIVVKTPEPAMDLMLNRWLLYQTLSARVFGRTGFYQSSGAFGFRDQLQDVLSLLHAAPALARAHILEAATRQFEEGDVLHWWHPPSGRGVRTRCSDDLAWLPYVTSAYVAATGDVAILDVPVPFLRGALLRADEHDRYAAFDEAGTVAPLYEHCLRALTRAATEGAHGLPLMGGGDWNDGMSRVGAEGRGESVWLAWFLCATMDRFAALAARRGEQVVAASWRARAAALRAKTEEVAWDGEWYLRAFHDDGSRVGGKASRECRIDSIAQSWSVLSRPDGAAPDARALAALRAVEERLVREPSRLVLLLWPPFDSTVHDPGYVRAYPPGIRENGGQYTHAATWLGFAHVAAGDGASAERIFRLLNPALRSSTEEDAARYRVEPYVLAGDIYSCSPWVGRGGWTWYTGAASWLWRLGVEEILGLKEEDGALRLDPCIPPSWPGFEAWVRRGERTVHITVSNPEHVAGGVAELTLDGVLVDAGRLELEKSATMTPEVHVRLGAAALPARVIAS